MIELIEVKDPRDAKWYQLFGIGQSGFKRWKVTCDICGETTEREHLYYHYGFGDPGYLWNMEIEALGFKTIEYGNLNPRKLLICSTHKDAEIEKVILDLI
jgi:hypothetical protein